MKRLVLTLLLLVPHFLCGCALTTKLGGLAIWSNTAMKTIVVNNTAELKFTIFLDGKLDSKYYVQPGQHYTVQTLNFGDPSRDHVILVQAENVGGSVVGVATRSFSQGRYEASAEQWVINTRDLQMRQ